jgi:hypothetical protein
MRHPLVLLIMIVAVSLFLASCSVTGQAADPGDWGFNCLITYNALGGVVNNREIRETYYMKNSYLFKPSGTTNMLIEPVRDGYVLAGWYTAMEEVPDDQGAGTGYAFKGEDRWDFFEDRVQDDMTLYARWIPQGRVSYIDPETGEVKFSKNITSDEAIQPLSSAAEQLIAKAGMTFDGYYADPELTEPFRFNEYVHKEMIPTNQEVYDQLFEIFPDYFEKIDFEEPSKEELESQLDTSDLYINRLGYRVVTDDPEARAEIRRAKDQIYEDAIEYYTVNTANKEIYLKYSEGRFVHVGKPSDLKFGSKTGFFGLDKSGNPIDGYIFTNDIDFRGETFTMAGPFSGRLIGNGFTLKNIKLVMKTKKMDQDKHKDVALFEELDGAYLENLTFEDILVDISIDPGVTLNAAPLAIKSKKTTLKNVIFKEIVINTGMGDDGEALYRLGDLFVQATGTVLDQVTAENIVFKSSEFAEISRLLD